MSEQFLPIEIVNPVSGIKVPEVLHKNWPSYRKFGEPVSKFDLDKIKWRLNEIRKNSIENLDALIKQLTESLKRYARVNVFYASNAEEAVSIIKNICTFGTLTVNRSNTVQELKDLLEHEFKIEESYYEELMGYLPTNRRRPYWKLPLIPPEVKWRSFISRTFNWSERQEVKDRVILYGVNAISAEDGTIFFLEHSRNITRGLQEAANIILLVGLEKIVRNRDEALFQTLCAGLFGFEGIAADLSLQSLAGPSQITGMQKSSEVKISHPQISIILLDNGRTMICEKFREFLYCIGCRTCNALCPSFISYEKPFEGPRSWLRMFNEVFGHNYSVTIGNELVWSCRTCKLCEESCPVNIKQVEKFIKIREHLIEVGRAAPTLRDALVLTFLYGNPWGRARDKRDEWAEGLDVKKFSGQEFLYYVCCATSYDDRCKEIARSLSKIFKAAGISFGILGKDETCCGSEMRRIGEKGLFEELARQNIEIFKNTGVKRIVTTSPHCFNVFKNEYNMDIEILHYTELIAKLIHKIELRELNYKITYHDPCYLGRWNDIYDDPRKILDSIPGIKFIEMEANRERSFCCGGGGGHMWFDWPRRPRPSEMRVNQAIETGADILAVACPFCLSMLEDAVKTLGYEDKIKVKDISELIAEAMT
ncbi:MAG: heterodisulfide reductase-related iron-sulfur binding cluster [Thermoproteota archaeon]